MSKLKININKKDPPARIIQQYKDADDFMSVYKKLHKPSGIRELFLKDKKKISMLAVLLMLLLIWVLSEENLKQEDDKPIPKIELTK